MSSTDLKVNRDLYMVPTVLLRETGAEWFSKSQVGTQILTNDLAATEHVWNLWTWTVRVQKLDDSQLWGGSSKGWGTVWKPPWLPPSPATYCCVFWAWSHHSWTTETSARKCTWWDKPTAQPLQNWPLELGQPHQHSQTRQCCPRTLVCSTSRSNLIHRGCACCAEGNPGAHRSERLS